MVWFHFELSCLCIGDVFECIDLGGGGGYIQSETKPNGRTDGRTNRQMDLSGHSQDTQTCLAIRFNSTQFHSKRKEKKQRNRSIEICLPPCLSVFLSVSPSHSTVFRFSF